MQKLDEFASDHRARVLVLTGDEVSVDDPVVCEGVPEAGLGLEVGAGLAQLGLGMERRGPDPELLHLLVGDAGDTTPLHEGPAIGGRRVAQAERAVAHAADELAEPVGLGDRIGELA